jgi:hypothetical protein
MNLGFPYTNLSVTTSWGWRNDYSNYTRCNNSVISSEKLIGVDAPIYCLGCNASNITLTDSQMYCTGFSPTVAENWSFGVRTQALTVNHNSSSIEIYFPGNAWLDLVPVNSSSWMVKAKLNLQVRSDNRVINTSPVISSYPSYCVRQGYNYTIVIPMVDVNQDDLRCRWSTNSILSGDECGGICGIIKNLSILSYSKSQSGYECRLTFRGDIASNGKMMLNFLN